MKKLVVVAVVSMMLMPAVVRATAMRPGDYEIRGTYEGVLFCLDCVGVWTQLTLEDSGPNIGIGRGTFVMSERFSGGVHKGETILTTGSWRAISLDDWGTSGLLELRGTTSSAPRYFQCEGGRDLITAKADGTADYRGPHQIEQSRLTRVMPPARPVFASLGEDDAERIVYGRVGDRFSIHLSLKRGNTSPPDASTFALADVRQVPAAPAVLDVYGREAFVDIIAANPGTATLRFENRAKPRRLLSFHFQISP